MSYSVPTNTDSVRRFKRNYWSGGTEFYCAPEVDVDVRSDPDQAPDDIVSPRSDIFSLGCILMKFLWLAQDHYHTEEWHQLDLDQTWAYEWFPYSRVLVDLVRQCLEKDARARPRPLELFKITREHAARTKSEVQYYFDRDRIRNGGIYYGMLLSRDQQTLFMENPTFAQRVLRETDWFYNNHTKMQLLLNTRQNPLASAPPPGCIALLSGLQGHMPLADLARIYHGVPQGNYLEKMPVYDAQGREVVGSGGHPFLRYVGQERLRVPELNKNWKAERARREAYRLERERVWEEQLARARQDAMRHPPGLAADVRNLGEVRPRLLDGGYGNIDPNLGYGRPPLLPLRPPPPPPPPHDNAGGRAGLFRQVGRGRFKGLKRTAPAPAPAAIGDFLGGVKGGRVAKRGGGEGRGGGGYKM